MKQEVILRKSVAKFGENMQDSLNQKNVRSGYNVSISRVQSWDIGVQVAIYSLDRSKFKLVYGDILHFSAYICLGLEDSY